MVKYARQHGVKPAARLFDSTAKTVRKWLGRFDGRLDSLADRSRAPKNPQRHITDAQRKEAIRLKKKYKGFGAERLREMFGLGCSGKAIRKIWREEGLLRRKRRKHKTKQNLRALKAQWRPFLQTCLDTKDLNDIPELWPQIRLQGLPLVQYTAREVTSGLQFLAYAQERSLACANLFAELLIAHFKSNGVALGGCTFQTDNGSEFIGSWNAKDDSAFTKTIEAVTGLVHRTIPPGAHTWQSDVETAHRLIEDEFYEVEHFKGRKNFIEKAYSYNWWFNVARKNSYKENQTPLEIIEKCELKISPLIAEWTPVYLDELINQKLDSQLKGGYHVVPHP
jgi:transposase